MDPRVPVRPEPILKALYEEIEKRQQRIAALEAERRVLAEALRVTYQAHQDIHRCTLCAQMWDRLVKLTALAPECSCRRMAEVSAKEWAERAPCGPSCTVTKP